MTCRSAHHLGSSGMGRKADIGPAAWDVRSDPKWTFVRATQQSDKQAGKSATLAGPLVGSCQLQPRRLMRLIHPFWWKNHYNLGPSTALTLDFEESHRVIRPNVLPGVTLARPLHIVGLNGCRFGQIG